MDFIYAEAQPLIDTLHPSLAVEKDGVLPRRDPLTLSDSLKSTQTVLSQAVFQKRLRDALQVNEFCSLSFDPDSSVERLRDALRKYDFRSLLFDPGSSMAPFKELPGEDWDLIYTRRHILALLRRGANVFLPTKTEDAPSFSTVMCRVMIRLYLGCYVYDDSAAQTWIRYCLYMKRTSTGKARHPRRLQMLHRLGTRSQTRSSCGHLPQVARVSSRTRFPRETLQRGSRESSSRHIVSPSKFPRLLTAGGARRRPRKTSRHLIRGDRTLQ